MGVGEEEETASQVQKIIKKGTREGGRWRQTWGGGGAIKTGTNYIKILSYSRQQAYTFDMDFFFLNYV